MMATREEYFRDVGSFDPWHEPVMDSEVHDIPPTEGSRYQIVPYSDDLFEVALGIAREMVEHERAFPLAGTVILERGLPIGGETTRRPIFGDHIARKASQLRVRLASDPEFLLRKAVYAATALTIGAVFFGMLGLGLAVLLAAAVLITWGAAGLLTFSLIGHSSFDPRLALVLLLLGIGTVAVALVSIVLG
jgi:hypothetical protein